MNRRQLIQLSLMAALAPAGQIQAAPKPRKGAGGSPKKGLGGGAKFIEQLNCKWFYNWTPRVPEGAPRGIPFIPMVNKYKGNEQIVISAETSAKSGKVNELLCFNEPDQKKQGDMTVQEALDAWPLLQKTKLRLGSPACVHPDNEWMKSFMAQAKKLELKVDFVCIHSYGAPNAAAFINRLEAIYKLYKKPIWITEFAVGDWSAKSPAENQHKPDDILKYMKDVLPELDKLDFIERYAWFPAGVSSAPLGTSALWDATDKLTPLGECYRDS
jgi:Glycosyl hydrolase catalytic core